MSDAELAANAEGVIGWIRLMLVVLSYRVMTLTALAIGAIISVWAAMQPDLYRTVVAVAFWPVAFWPTLWMERAYGKGS